jgi:hypothetical protein
VCVAEPLACWCHVCLRVGHGSDSTSRIYLNVLVIPTSARGIIHRYCRLTRFQLIIGRRVLHKMVDCVCLCHFSCPFDSGRDPLSRSSWRERQVGVASTGQLPVPM